ncbi:MAG: hypothetical protein KAG99_07500 [Bacteroidales bacterium]|nr:hypothetical protein [Bacteroidales bacterium]
MKKQLNIITGSWLIIIIIALSACNFDTTRPGIHNTPQIIGLASPVKLQPGATKIHLTDYFTTPSLIDSIFINDKKIITGDGSNTFIYEPDNDFPYLSEMKVWLEGIPYSILVKKSTKTGYTFTFEPKGKIFNAVQVAGSINGWNPSATNMQWMDNTWQATVMLDPGIYQYQLVFDGLWSLDPGNPDSIDNNAGGFNSLLVVGDKDKQPPHLFTTSHNKNKITIGGLNDIQEYFVYWQNYRLEKNFLNIKKNKIIISIPEAAKMIDRSFIRVWAFNADGTSNDLLIPLHNGQVLNNIESLTRQDKETFIIYNIMVDRFFNGDTGNDYPVPDPAILPEANYLGGDLAGITFQAKQGFFKDLGVNTIWISPIILNPEGAFGQYPDPLTKFSGYHGYWPISFTKIDYRYGTSDEFHNLVSTLHDDKMNILLDFVAHHVHQEHPVYIAHPDWVTNLYLPDGSLNTERWDEHRLTTWFDVFLPTLDLSKPEVYEMLADSAVFWIDEYELDGFRHDATKHIPEVFWRTLTKKLKNRVVISKGQPVFQIGETYGNGELIGSYVNSGELDAQFDFNVYDAAVAVFANDNESFERLNNTINESFKYYGHHHLMGNISGNQDRGRFISYAGGDLKFDEDAKKAGWTREIGVGDSIGYQKMEQLMALNMTIPGVPVIFYGDEIGMPGGNDPDNRKMMLFECLTKKETQVKETVKQLIKLRKKNLEFMYGDFEVLSVSTNTYVFARTYFDRIGIVVFNKSDEPIHIEFYLPDRFRNAQLISQFGSDIFVQEDLVVIDLGGDSFEILIN